MPAFNQARAIEPAVAAARAALDGALRGLRGRIVVADIGSTDDTATLARAAGGDIHLVAVPASAADAMPYHGMPGRARALRTLSEAVLESGARGVAVVDITAPSLSADRIARLLRPVVSDRFDYVAPVYRRAPFDGALVKGIVRPVYRACFGLRLRQPTGPDFACSRRFVERVLQPRAWPADASDAGIDLWLAATAASDGFAVCEAAVGERLRGIREEPSDLAGTIEQVVGALFSEVERRASAWQRVRSSTSVPQFDDDPATAPPASAVDAARLIESFRLGYRELSDVWAEVLPPAVILEMKALAGAPVDRFRIDDRAWAHIVYDFAVGHRTRVIARPHLLQSLAPLYLGWVASLILEAQAAGDSEAEVEERIERLCETFEAEKPYLISRWRWPERFRPARR
jgi:hypothetical protein